jgi:hypothetical protein
LGAGLCFAISDILIFAQEKRKRRISVSLNRSVSDWEFSQYNTIRFFPHKLAAQSRKETAQLCSAFEMKASYSIIIFG